MQKVAVWLFRGWARPALTLATLLIVFELMWKHFSEGLAACFGMMCLLSFFFLKVIDRNVRVTAEEREMRRSATRVRRSRRTAALKQMISAHIDTKGPSGTAARAIIARWDEAATAKAKARLRAAMNKMGIDSVQREFVERGISRMSGEQAERLAIELEAGFKELTAATEELKHALDEACAQNNDKPRS